MLINLVQLLLKGTYRRVPFFFLMNLMSMSGPSPDKIVRVLKQQAKQYPFFNNEASAATSNQEKRN
ncbi:hypothetical protein ACK32R_03550 [Aeromonas dhakensis]|jgi:hypothetical protein|uniref:hypothetical protein n=1 Tax=Aeromonas dhakensis TaxID=196024 RepID=UPI0039875386